MQGPVVEHGSFTGAGAAVDVEVGFKPSSIEVWNPAATTTESAEMRWLVGMSETAGVSQERDAAGAQSLLTTTGIKLKTGASIQTTDPVQNTGYEGFTIPAGMAVSGDTIYWRAIR